MTSRTDTVRLINGRIYRSAWDENPVDTIVIGDGRVIGCDAQSGSPVVERTVDLKGASVIPGLTDAHIHLFAIAHARLQVPLTPRDAADIPTALALLGKRARNVQPGKWVYAAGLDENGLSEQRLPTRLRSTMPFRIIPC